MERASCLVIINLDFVVLSLIYFSPRCFDLKDFNLKKRFEPLRNDSSCLPDQMSRQMYVVYRCLRFQIRPQFIFRNEKSIAIHSKPNENSVRLVENMG